MKSNTLLLVQNLEDIKDYKEAGITTFLFPLKGFCVGYEKTFYLDEIACFPNSYVLVNAIMDCNLMDAFKDALDQLNSFIKGIAFEDIGVFQALKSVGYKGEMLLWQSHFGISSAEISFWLERGVRAVRVGDELTLEEYTSLVKAHPQNIILPILGYRFVMYSRRHLVTNYLKHSKLQPSHFVLINEPITKQQFLVKESELGTVLFHKPVTFATELYDLEVPYFYLIDTNFMEKDQIMTFLNCLKTKEEPKIPFDKGFLYRETIYKLKELKHEGN